MKTDALIEALRAAGIDPATALRLFSLWLDSTANELHDHVRFADEEHLRYLAGHLHANAKALEAETKHKADIEQQDEERRGWLKMTSGEEIP